MLRALTFPRFPLHGRIYSVRKGFATNSSSSHSLLFWPLEDRTATAEELEASSESWHDYGFGWENFTLATKKSKLRYLLAQIGADTRRPYPDERSLEAKLDDLKAILDTVVDALPVEKRDEARADFAEFLKDGYFAEEFDDCDVDHQSTWTFPLMYGKETLHPKFIAEIYLSLIQPEVVVLGGNDNGDDHPLYDERLSHKTLNRIPTESIFPYIARFDPVYDFWTLFSAHNGDKYRMRFSPEPLPIEKASRPELVDLKITDFCPFGCSFCYQSSTLKGKHAPLEHIEQIAVEMRRLEVFEVAMGGGEPTLHPQFDEIMAMFNRLGMVVNFTTRNFALLRRVLADDETWKTWSQGLGIKGIGVSIHSLEECHNLLAILENFKVSAKYIPSQKLTLQVVMGAHPLEEIIEVIKAANTMGLRTLLLGFKQVGFGKESVIHPYNDWLDRIAEAFDQRTIYSPKVGIDTALAQTSMEALEKHGIPKWCYEVKEGAFSMYIDAVRGLAGASSYVEPNEYRPFLKAEHLLEIFQGLDSSLPKHLKQFRQEAEGILF